MYGGAESMVPEYVIKTVCQMGHIPICKGGGHN